MTTLWQDIRFSFRMLAKNRVTTIIAVIMMAFGIGANAAIFSVVNAVLLRPLPYRNPDSLVMVWGNFGRLNMMKIGASAPEFVDIKAQSDVFSDVAAYQRVPLNLSGSDEPERITGIRATASLFTLLGTRPLVGRPLLAEEEQPGRERVVVLSYGLWQRRFNGDAAIINRTISLDGESYTVVGVMPRGFQFPFGASSSQERADVWMPAAFGNAELSDRSRYSLRVIARLKPDVTLEAARAEIDAIGKRLEQQYPRSYRGPKGEDGGWQMTVTTLQDEVVGNSRLLLYVLLGVVGFVLLIACANVTNLQLARAAARQREIAIRTALGASRWRVVRQLLTENIMLSLAGGAIGLLLATWGVDLLIAASPHEIPRLDEVRLDGRVLGFTLVVSLLTGLLFGLAPALRSSHTNLNESLKEGGKGASAGAGRQRLRGLLVVSEVALALVLLVGTGLMIKSFSRLLEVKPGFDAENVVTMQLWLSPARYSEAKDKENFYRQLLERVKETPGIEAASLTTALPLSGVTFGGPFSIEGRPFDTTGKPPHAYVRTIAPGYFRVMSIPFVKGRDLSPDDTSDSVPVVIINETFAREFFANGEALGQRVKVGGPQAPRPWMQIAGVVKDVKSDGLDAETIPEMYLPFSQNTGPSMTLVARTGVDTASGLAALRRDIQAIDRDQPVYNIRTMNQLLEESIAQRRFNMLALAAFALVALVLAAAGIYGVMAYSVTQRTHEIGIRMALGAQGSDVLKMVVGQGMILTLIGLGLGLIAAFALTRVISGLLFNVSATDPLTFAFVSLMLACVALLACYIPARRATRVDPMRALHYE